MLMQLETSYVLDRRGVGGTPKKRSEAPDVTDVVLPSVGSQPSHHHVFLHALAERCGRGIVLKAGH